MDLTRESLARRLDADGVSRRAYDLYGSNAGEQYVLDHQGSRWSVFYSERGLQREKRDFDTEAGACADLRDRVLRDPTTRNTRRYEPLLQQFVSGAMPAEEFCDTFLAMWREDRDRREPTGDALDDLMTGVDCYSPNPKPGDRW